MLKRWFVDKYNLPTTHTAYTCQSEAEWLEEWYSDLYANQERYLAALKQLSDSGLPVREQEAQRRQMYAKLTSIAQALDEPLPQVMHDPVIDDIEARMARGETDIDMSALLPKGWKPPRQ